MRTTRVELVITRLQGEGLNHWAKRAADKQSWDPLTHNVSQTVLLGVYP